MIEQAPTTLDCTVERYRPGEYARLDRILDRFFGDQPRFAVGKSVNGEERVRLHVQDPPEWGETEYFIGIVRPNSAVMYVEIMLPTAEGPLNITTAIDLVENYARQEVYDHHWKVIPNPPNPNPVEHTLYELGRLLRGDGRYNINDMAETNGRHIFLHEDLY